MLEYFLSKNSILQDFNIFSKADKNKILYIIISQKSTEFGRLMRFRGFHPRDSKSPTVFKEVRGRNKANLTGFQWNKVVLKHF